MGGLCGTPGARAQLSVCQLAIYIISHRERLGATASPFIHQELEQMLRFRAETTSINLCEVVVWWWCSAPKRVNDSTLRSPTNLSVSQSGEQRISTKLQRLGFHGNITTATRPLIFTHHFPQTSLFFCRLARSGHPIHNTTYLLFTTYDDLCHLPLLNHR